MTKKSSRGIRIRYWIWLGGFFVSMAAVAYLGPDLTMAAAACWGGIGLMLIFKPWRFMSTPHRGYPEDRGGRRW